MPPSAQLADPVGDPDVWRSDGVNSTDWGPAVNLLESSVRIPLVFKNQSAVLNCRATKRNPSLARPSAHLPSGPRPPPSELPSLPTAVSVEALDDAYGAWINAVEREALTFSAPGREEAAAMSGHVFGHSVSLRNELGPPGSQHLKQVFGARRWRLLAGWLM